VLRRTGTASRRVDVPESTAVKRSPWKRRRQQQQRQAQRRQGAAADLETVSQVQGGTELGTERPDSGQEQQGVAEGASNVSSEVELELGAAESLKNGGMPVQEHTR